MSNEPMMQFGPLDYFIPYTWFQMGTLIPDMTAFWDRVGSPKVWEFGTISGVYGIILECHSKEVAMEFKLRFFNNSSYARP